MKSLKKDFEAYKGQPDSQIFDEVFSTLLAFNDNEFGVERVVGIAAAVFSLGVIAALECGKIAIQFELDANATGVALIAQILVKYHEHLEFVTVPVWAETHGEDRKCQTYFEAEAYRGYAKELLAIADDLDRENGVRVINDSTH